MHSSSTRAFRARPPVPNALRAGKAGLVKYCTYTPLNVLHSFMSARNTVHFTTSANEAPLRSSTSLMFSIICLVSGTMPPATSLPSVPVPSWPARNSKSPARTACENGRLRAANSGGLRNSGLLGGLMTFSVTLQALAARAASATMNLRVFMSSNSWSAGGLDRLDQLARRRLAVAVQHARLVQEEQGV